MWWVGTAAGAISSTVSSFAKGASGPGAGSWRIFSDSNAAASGVSVTSSSVEGVSTVLAAASIFAMVGPLKYPTN